MTLKLKSFFKPIARVESHVPIASLSTMQYRAHKLQRWLTCIKSDTMENLKAKKHYHPSFPASLFGEIFLEPLGHNHIFNCLALGIPPQFPPPGKTLTKKY